MEKKTKLSALSIVALLISILAFALYVMVFNNSGLYFLWIIASIAAFVFPILAKYIRVKNGAAGKGLEITALVIGCFDFFFVIFAATAWNIYIAFALIAIVCMLYAKLFNNLHVEQEQRSTDAEELTMIADPNVSVPASGDTLDATPVRERDKTQKRSKQRYCKFCGGAIDTDTRRCTKCGKQYFKLRFKKGAILSVLALIIIVALAVLNVYQYRKYQQYASGLRNEISAMEVEITKLQADINELEEMNAGQSATISEQTKTIRNLNAENSAMSKEISFYDKHVVFVLDDDTYRYHKYDCIYFKYSGSSFWAYNIEAAKTKGYSPCWYCCG